VVLSSAALAQARAWPVCRTGTGFGFNKTLNGEYAYAKGTAPPAPACEYDKSIPRVCVWRAHSESLTPQMMDRRPSTHGAGLRRSED
jgi:hypothetical protein